jgi:AcrR family transcriptional regulator
MAAALQAFARKGYWGTNTTEVAHAAGISQAYLYRLFESKEVLFVAVLAEVKRRLTETITEALNDAAPGRGLEALLATSDPAHSSDQGASMVLLHATAAASVGPIGVAVRECYRAQINFLSGRGLSDPDIRAYLAWSQYGTALHASGISPGATGGDLLRLLP